MANPSPISPKGIESTGAQAPARTLMQKVLDLKVFQFFAKLFGFRVKNDSHTTPLNKQQQQVAKAPARQAAATLPVGNAGLKSPPQFSTTSQKVLPERPVEEGPNIYQEMGTVQFDVGNFDRNTSEANLHEMSMDSLNQLTKQASSLLRGLRRVESYNEASSLAENITKMYQTIAKSMNRIDDRKKEITAREQTGPPAAA